MPAGTTMGHVHLQVADIPAAEAFYNGGVGLDVMVRSYPGALFLAAGGYHHHVGLNTWQSQGAPPPPEGALGLDRYELVFPDEAARRDSAADRLAEQRRPGAARGGRAGDGPVGESGAADASRLAARPANGGGEGVRSGLLQACRCRSHGHPSMPSFAGPAGRRPPY